MFRECIRHERLAKLIFESSYLHDFFEYLQVPGFEISSDAFLSFRTLLTEHKRLTANFIMNHYDDFFDPFNALLTSDNYVTKLSSLQFLSTLLIDRYNYNIMSKYVSDTKNLKRVMIAMKDTHRNIQFEAYHAFKLFVVNPASNPAIASILFKNKERLVKHLHAFQQDRDNDQFTEEKMYLIKQIQELPETSCSNQSSGSIDTGDSGSNSSTT
jgi:calcium binding protein 39